MPLNEEVVLDIQSALRQIGELESRLQRIGTPIDVPVDIDTSGTEQLANDLRQADAAAEGLASGLGAASTAADSTEIAARALQKAFGLSDAEARELAGSLGQASFEADLLEAEMRRAARELGLTDDEARALTAGLRQSATASRQVADETARARATAQGLSSDWALIRRQITAAAGALGIRFLVREFNEAVTAASNLEQSIGGVQSIFGEAADEILKAGEAAAQTTGLTRNAFNELSALLGAQLGAFGFDTSEVAAKTQELIELGADLAATFGGPVADAVGAISSLLRGERNPIERYGVALNEAMIRAHAFETGITNTNRQLTLQESAVASLSLLYQQTASAQGQFAREADTTAGALERQRAEFGNIQAEIGEALVPLFQALLEMGPSIADIFRGMAGALEAVMPTVQTLVTGLGVGLTSGFGQAAAAGGALLVVLRTIQAHPVIATISLLGGALAFAAGRAEELRREAQELIDAWDDLDVSIRSTKIGELFTASQLDLLQQAGVSIRDLATGVVTFAEARDRLESSTPWWRPLGSEVELKKTLILLDDLAKAEEEAAAAAQAALEVRQQELETQRLLNTARLFRRQQADPGAQERARVARQTAELLARTTAEAERLAAAEEVLQRVQERTGASFAFIANNLGLFSTETRRAAHEIGLTELELRDLADALALASTVDFSLQSAVDEFELLLTVTNKAGVEVPATMKQMLNDLLTQANDFAELEAGTTILEALGLVNLAAEIRSQGTDAIPALREFLADMSSALEAEALLTAGGTVGEETMAALIESVKKAEPEVLTAILSNIDQFTSAEVRQAILEAAFENENTYTDEFKRLLAQSFSELNLVLPVTLTPRVNQRAFDEWNQGANAPGGGAPGGGGGGININFYSTPQPTTDTARIHQALRSFN